MIVVGARSDLIDLSVGIGRALCFWCAHFSRCTFLYSASMLLGSSSGIEIENEAEILPAVPLCPLRTSQRHVSRRAHMPAFPVSA